MPGCILGFEFVPNMWDLGRFFSPMFESWVATAKREGCFQQFICCSKVSKKWRTKPSFPTVLCWKEYRHVLNHMSKTVPKISWVGVISKNLKVATLFWEGDELYHRSFLDWETVPAHSNSLNSPLSLRTHASGRHLTCRLTHNRHEKYLRGEKYYATACWYYATASLWIDTVLHLHRFFEK